MCKDIMQNERAVTEKSYRTELYNACKYMIRHSEEFKEFEIYNSLKVDGDLHFKREAFSNLHNRLLSQYDFFVGKGMTKSDAESVKGSDIMPVIDISCLDNPQILSQILAVYHHFINKEEKAKKLTWTLINVNVDKSDEMIDYLINKIDSEGISCNSFKQLNGVRKQLTEKLKNDFWENYKSEPGDQGEIYRQRIKFFEEELVNNLNVYDTEFGSFSPIFQVWLYIDLCCFAILQFVIHGIIRNKQDENKMESIEKLNKEIIRLIELEKKEKHPVKLEGTAEEMMFSTYSYYYERDKYLHNIKVLDYITKPEKERRNPSPEYSLILFSPQKGKIKWQEILDLFLEGESKKSLRSFKENLLKCYKGIFQFNKRADRKLKPDPITLRAFYREIYLDSTLYNRRQSMTIFHDFLEQKDMGEADYYFIDEKINTGMFREYGATEEFCAKNKLHGNLYYLVCQILTALNPPDIINKFKKVLESISFTISEIYNSNPAPVKTRTDEEKKMVSEILDTIKEQEGHVEEIQYEDMKNLMALCFKLYNTKFPDGKL